MPSNDDTEYSVFDNDEVNELDDSADDSRTGPDGVGPRSGESRLGSDEDGCPKCGGTATETDEIATSGTGLTKLFDVQNRKFVVVSCADCGYSELYKGQSTGNAIDFFIG